MVGHVNFFDDKVSSTKLPKLIKPIIFSIIGLIELMDPIVIPESSIPSSLLLEVDIWVDVVIL